MENNILEKIVHKTWLLDGWFHSAPGFITIDRGQFTFSLVDTGTFSAKRLQKFESFKLISETFKKLRSEEVVEIINIPLTRISAKFPWYSMHGGAILYIEGFDQKVQLSFMQPQNTKFPYHKIDNSLLQLMAVGDTANDMKKGRVFGKKFEKALKDYQ